VAGGSGSENDFVPPTENVRREGAVDMTDVGEGTERVRLGLEGEWSGMASASRPGSDQEGGGAGWLRPSAVGASVRGGFGETYDIMNPPTGKSAYPMTSSYAYERTPDRWVSNEGEFPGGLEEGTFPGVNPNDPDGTSWMIGMHRDGEETVGRWANAPRRAGLAHTQQLSMLRAGVLLNGKSTHPQAGEGKLTVIRAGRGRRVEAREEQMLDMTGADITDLGETNRDHNIDGEWGNKPEATSWVVGEHRQLHWSESQTFACSTTSLCKKGRADIHHSFQADTNPYVDKRRVFDAEAQLDRDDDNHGAAAYPWDPTLDPQIWRSATPHCGDGKLRSECWDRLGGKGKPPIPVSSTMAAMRTQIQGSQESRPRWKDGVRLLRGALGFELGGQGLLDAPMGSDSWDQGDGRVRSRGDMEGPGYPIAHYKHGERLKPLGDETPFGEGAAPYGDHSEWPYAAHQAIESWPTWAARPGSSNSAPKKLDAAVPKDYYDWGLGSNAKILNSGHTAGAPHDSEGEKDSKVPEGEKDSKVPVSGAMNMKGSATSSLYVGAHRHGKSGAGGRDDDWEKWVDLALARSSRR